MPDGSEQSGTPEAAWRRLLGEAVAAHGRQWFALAHRVLADAHLAEDVCQEAMLKAWEHRRTIRDVRTLRGWLTSTVLNQSLAILRRKKVERRAIEQQRLGLAGASEPVDGLALRESLADALEDLPEQTRAVVLLRLMDSRSGNEVSELLGCSASEVSRRLHEGVRLLRPRLADWARE